MRGRGLDLWRSSTDQLARPLLEEAVKLEPRLLGAWLQLSHLCWEGGDIRRALACIVQGLGFVTDGSTRRRAAPAAAVAVHCGAASKGPEGIPAAAASTSLATAASAAPAAAGAASAAPTTSSGKAIVQTCTKEPPPASPTLPAGCGGGSASSSAAVAAADHLGAPSAKEALQQLSMLVRQQQQEVHRHQADEQAQVQAQKQKQQQKQPKQHTKGGSSHSAPGGQAGKRGGTQQNARQGNGGGSGQRVSVGGGGELPLRGEAASREALSQALGLSRDLAAAALEMDLDDAYSWCEWGWRCGGVGTEVWGQRCGYGGVGPDVWVAAV